MHLGITPTTFKDNSTRIYVSPFRPIIASYVINSSNLYIALLDRLKLMITLKRGREIVLCS